MNDPQLQQQSSNPGNLKEHLEQIHKERAQYIEMFSAAFVEQVGTTEASKYQLVETVEHTEGRMVTTWKFEERRDAPGNPSDS